MNVVLITNDARHRQRWTEWLTELPNKPFVRTRQSLRGEVLEKIESTLDEDLRRLLPG